MIRAPGRGIFAPIPPDGAGRPCLFQKISDAAHPQDPSYLKLEKFHTPQVDLVSFSGVCQGPDCPAGSDPLRLEICPEGSPPGMLNVEIRREAAETGIELQLRQEPGDFAQELLAANCHRVELMRDAANGFTSLAVYREGQEMPSYLVLQQAQQQ